MPSFGPSACIDSVLMLHRLSLLQLTEFTIHMALEAVSKRGSRLLGGFELGLLLGLFVSVSVYMIGLWLERGFGEFDL